MKAPKIKFDSAKLQQMLMLHVEKIVLCLVLVAVAWFIYQGVSLPNLDETKSPDKLSSEAQRMTTEINNPGHWDIIKNERKIEHDVQGLVKQGQVANVSTAYVLNSAWKIPDYPKAISRPDPRLFAPEKVKVVVLHGPMAFLPTKTDVDPILGASINTGPGMEGAQPVRPVPPPRQPPGEGKRPTRPKRGPGGVLEGPGGEGMMEGMGMGPPVGMPGMPGTASKVLHPESIIGYHAGGETIAKEARAAVIMAAVPVEKQFEEYEKSFKDALDFDPARDVPRYVLYRIERADVTANPGIDPAQANWELLSIPRALNEMNMTWGPSPAEVVELNALDPILTNRVPPFMQREIHEALLHPDIPVAHRQTAEELAAGMAGPRPGAVPAANPSEDLTDPTAAPIAPGGNMPGPGGEGGMRMPRPGFGEGMRMPPRGPGEGMMGMGPNGQMGPQVALAKYRLLRFTDTTIQPNHKYRYRVKLILEDPNNPYVGDQPPRWDPSRSQPLRKPSIQSMSPAALARVRRAETVANPATRPFLLETDYSEPSEIAELPPVTRYFAGKATAGNGGPLAIGTPPNVTMTPPILTTQPLVNLLTVGFDNKLATDVAGEKEVYRGSMLNFEKEIDVIHPSLLSVHNIGKYTFKTNAMVLDFVGGTDIPNLDTRRSDKVPEPCEILIFDGDGNLQLLDEADDVEGFRRYLPPKPDEHPSTNAGAPQRFPGDVLGEPAVRPKGPVRPRGKGDGP
ncbi:hypothetical protein [Anatilimnocola floriformis]|uniref:hypothetical protein n=1 Tax=Anatilimnocola floriformis TaxID=2948575 RepID=UPI0020C1C127|nr:hypothetical protein [Anatilimnocola floriformis]